VFHLGRVAFQDRLSDATGLDFGDRFWICNAAIICV